MKRRQQVPDSFACPDCGMVSYGPEDVRDGYCGHCHRRPYIDPHPQEANGDVDATLDAAQDLLARLEQRLDGLTKRVDDL